MNHVPFPAMKRPLVAILRGVRPDEAQAIVGTLLESGFTAIEIPLNSPDPFHSIEIAVKMAPADVLIGAGTVLTTESVENLHDVARRLMVTPNTDPDVITRARAGHERHARRVHGDGSAAGSQMRRLEPQILSSK